jgi:PHD/YefM family antitoxin component YafN of YafNO toxin-antitoxin module
MFRIDQIINASQFIRHFKELAAHLSESNEPLLISQKNGRFLVVMDGEFFEEIMDIRAKTAGMSDHQVAKMMQNNSEFKS